MTNRALDTGLYRYVGPTRKLQRTLVDPDAGPHATFAFVQGQTTHDLSDVTLARLAGLSPPLVEFERVAPLAEPPEPVAVDVSPVEPDPNPNDDEDSE